MYDLDAVTDLIQIEKTPLYDSTHRVQRRIDRVVLATELYLQRLSDLVSALERSFDRLSKEKEKKDEKKKCEKSSRPIEIEDYPGRGALVFRQAFAQRMEKVKGKRKELTPVAAATKIQVTFKAYLIKRSQALRALRELAIAKSKLKEIRALFKNSYRRRVARDPEGRQRFSEKIIVLILTVDAIEGADIMVRAAKKSMVDELEAMLDFVDPQPVGKSLLMRRQFEMPDTSIQKELAADVAQPASWTLWIPSLLDVVDHQNDSETSEATSL